MKLGKRNTGTHTKHPKVHMVGKIDLSYDARVYRNVVCSFGSPINGGSM